MTSPPPLQAANDPSAVQPDGVPVLDLPTDRLRPPTPSGRVAQETLAVPAALRDRLDGPFLVASFAILLHRYTGQQELVIGWSGPAPSLLSLDLGGEPSFADVLERSRAALADAGSPSNGHLPRVTLALDAEPPAEAAHDLWLTVGREPGEPRLLLVYSMDLYDADTAARLLGHLQTIAATAAAEPERAVAELPLLTEPEREELLTGWNRTAASYPDGCLHDLVAEQARRTPDAIAVECGPDRLTYAELDTRANRLAHHLAGLGVGPEVLVGICVERSTAMLVGLLGILKAGGAYVPVDPAYPAERQAFMLEDARAPVIVTQERLLEHLPEHRAAVVCLDRDWPAIDRLPAEAPSVRSTQEQLAYVIYTSGSTGNPKGVQIPHRALVNFLSTMGEQPGLGADDVLVAVTTLSFDIAGLELYLPLVVGARVVVAPSATVSDPRALAGLLEQSGATVMQATPTTWRMLVDSGWEGWEGRQGLKALCGGEALPLALADELVARGLELWNMYGPTETTIWSAVARIQTQGEPLTIGRPIGNTTLYILDERLQPLPVGVPGELYIGGDGLARGYRGRPDLTDERFVPHPFDPTEAARIYRTGDLARYRRDGRVEFLGRIDHQVKVRGFRIELGEIETVLSRHPGVARAVAVARQDEHGGELVAYFVPSGVPVSSNGLRRFLGQSLPDYMVPSVVMSLEAFPLTPNGKVDRKALPAPTRERSDDQEYVGPRTPLEEQLAGIWERVLDIHPIGVTDNFFDLGVTSIVAAELFARIEHELRGSLPLGAVFRAPTIESLAQLLESDDDGARWTSLVPIQPNGSLTPIFCVHGGAGTILHLEPLARQLGREQPFYGLQARGLYGGAPPLRTVEAMSAHYLSEIRSVQPHGPYLLSGYCFGTIVAFHMARTLVGEGEQVDLLAMFNGPSPEWIRTWGWYGNQASRRAERPQRPTGTAKLALMVRNPRKIYRPVKRRIARLAVRVSLALGRDVPERLREMYFLRLSAAAERAYHPEPYAGAIHSFYGDGLYDDPELGWGGLAEAGIETHAVPGEHTNNRQIMNEPYVHFVRDRFREILTSVPSGTATEPSRREAASA